MAARPRREPLASWKAGKRLVGKVPGASECCRHIAPPCTVRRCSSPLRGHHGYYGRTGEPVKVAKEGYHCSRPASGSSDSALFLGSSIPRRSR
jgi:hypothetical protein